MTVIVAWPAAGEPAIRPRRFEALSSNELPPGPIAVALAEVRQPLVLLHAAACRYTLAMTKPPKTSTVRAVMNALGVGDRFNDSPLYGLYLSIRYPAEAESRRKERAFYASLLTGDGAKTIFDIGANYGAKAAIFAGLAQRVICLEPSSECAAALRRRFAANPGVVVVQKGVGSKAGSATLYEFPEQRAYSTFSEKWNEHVATFAGCSTAVSVPLVTLEDLIAEFGVPDYLKIDVEGAELDVILGLTTAVPVLSFECNLPIFAHETIDVIRRLAQINPAGAFNYVVTEPPHRVEAEEWLSPEAMIDVVTSGGYAFMEIYARNIS